MRPVKTSIRALIRRALRNRYDAETVKIGEEGSITCTFAGGRGKQVPFGNVSDYTADRTESGCVALYAGSSLVFTFGPKMR